MADAGENKNRSYAVITTPLEVKCKLPFELIPGHTLDKASNKQVEDIKKWLNEFGDKRLQDSLEYYTPENSVERCRLDPDKWRYFVVNYDETNQRLINELRPVAGIASVELPMWLTIVHSEATHGSALDPVAFSLMENSLCSFQSPRIIDEQILLQIKTTHTNYVALASEYTEVKRAIKMYQELKHISEHSDLRVLAMFAIIELVLTHNPDAKIEGESLTRQISTKMPLLMKKYDVPLDASAFHMENTEKLWKTLYTYRSKVAHGSVVQFEKGELRNLSDRDAVLKFLGDATRALLRYALAEPEFISDLKKC